MTRLCLGDLSMDGKWFVGKNKSVNSQFLNEKNFKKVMLLLVIQSNIAYDKINFKIYLYIKLKAGILLKHIIRIVILVIVVLLIFYIAENQAKDNKPLESPVKQGTAIPVEDKGIGSAIPQTSRPDEGISIFVGKPVGELIEALGEPDRVEPSYYQYDWWIYQKDHRLMASVTNDGIVNQLYTAADESNVAPFEMAQSIDDIYRFTIVGSEVDVQLDENMYTFSLNSEDMQTRPLIIFQDLYAQLYIDQEEDILKGVRFIDPETLILHQPYEMTYMGELLVSKPPSSIQQLEVNQTAERQIFELTNLIRESYHLPELRSNYALGQFARKHSELLAFENISTEETEKMESLTNRLKLAEIEHKKAGENTAFDYADAIEAVHGWLNSPDHRKVLLGKDFTHLGTGAYGNYFTETFIKSTVDDQLERQ